MKNVSIEELMAKAARRYALFERRRPAEIPTHSVVLQLHRQPGQAIPLAPNQRGLWALAQVERRKSVYQQCVLCRMEGDLSIEALTTALRDLCARQEILRSRFCLSDGQPLVEFSPSGHCPLICVDLDGLPEAESTRAQENIAGELVGVGCDFADDALFQCALLDLGKKHYVLAISIHHVISDGWSIGVFAREFTELYNASREGRASRLPALTVQFADYAIWQILATENHYWDDDLDYWLPRLRAAERRQRSIGRSDSGLASRLISLEIALPAEPTEQLEAAAREEGASLFAALLAGFAVLLRQVEGEEELWVASDVANRPSVATENLIGFFANQVLLRLEVDDKSEFGTLIGEMKRVAMEAMEHGSLPYNYLLDQVRPSRRALGENPLFNYKLVFQNTPPPLLELTGLRAEEFTIRSGRPKFDFLVNLWKRRGKIQGVIEADARAMGEKQVREMAETYLRVLTAGAADRTSQVSAIIHQACTSPRERLRQSLIRVRLRETAAREA